MQPGASFMNLRIEDYAIIGNTCTVALVGNNGSIDWLCVPRFDSPACFAALLGTEKNGRWLIAPRGEIKSTHRHYRGDTLILETEFETSDGVVAIIDFMPIHERLKQVDLVRIVEGRMGHVPMQMEAIFRFDYGHVVPWVTSRPDGLRAIAGPDAIKLRTSVGTRGEDFTTKADFTISRGERVPFTLTYFPSHEQEPTGKHPIHMLNETEAWWHEWSGRCTVEEPWRAAVMRSLITLKALTFGLTGGIVAAPTTSLPEKIGGERNWDYRICWLRDATFTLYALSIAGYYDEARAWRQWLLRAIAGEPAKMQIMYGLRGERRLTEFGVSWLPGYQNSAPVRIGNAAHEQFQLDVYGEVMDAFYAARKQKLDFESESEAVARTLMEFLETAWKEPDEGIWEVRGPRRHFTHSKMMAWVAADRAVKLSEKFGTEGPVDRWRKLRDEIRADVLERGFNSRRNAFVQYYGCDLLDASLLLMPLIGFLPAKDPRVMSTVAAIERDLMSDGLIKRYQSSPKVDGLPPGEGTFLACSFWYADNLALMGRTDEAREVFERLLSLRNDVGLLAEEYDTIEKRQVGNFPQAFSHVSLINTAHNLSLSKGPAKTRAT
jgi:GH15 family glucan-1,4-alpha-glucosidase